MHKPIPIWRDATMLLLEVEQAVPYHATMKYDKQSLIPTQEHGYEGLLQHLLF